LDNKRITSEGYIFKSALTSGMRRCEGLEPLQFLRLFAPIHYKQWKNEKTTQKTKRFIDSEQRTCTHARREQNIKLQKGFK
jgi:hypothetical protein